ncbi:MAG: DUF448 domain-containing protein [Armatimonadetes bacterium]|nr:DUF448 domain-containing protein [Armatimonadota bacterium]MBS1704142.1 DUF448 domain-containing protein [Armatimonadota bacterium]MBS1725514.1 DUF448 domain-containing protein [Armatimonadota bacterium]
MPSHVPIRTCIACRGKFSQESLFRLSLSEEHMPTPWTGQGRSAYVCKSRPCVESFTHKGRLQKAFKTGNLVPNEPLLQDLLCKLR